MIEEFLKICYDPAKKIWSSVHYPYTDQIQGSLGERFLKTMRSTEPTKLIDNFYDTNRQKTVKEVYEQSIIVAKNLQRLGIKRYDVVVFFCMNNEDVAVLAMGCILIGALVNFFEVSLTAGKRKWKAKLIAEYVKNNLANVQMFDYINSVFKTLKPTLILYEENHKEKCLDSLERLNFKNCKLVFSIDGHPPLNIKEQLLAVHEPVDFDEFESVQIRHPEHELALLLLTSGSTGIPKVVQITHTLLMHGCHIWWNNNNNYEPLDKDSVVFSFSPLRWISQAAMLFQSMLMGVRRVSSCGAPSGVYGLELLRRAEVTHIFAAPSIFKEILEELDENDVESLKSLKFIQLGGEAPATRLVELARKHCVNAKVFNCYGMTEMSSCITNDEAINGGKLLPGYQMQILDNNFHPVGPNESGQLAIKPPYPLKQYRSTEHTCLCNENGLVINGDYGFIDDENNLHVLDRYKDLIRSNNLVLVPNTLEHFIMELPEISTARIAGYGKPYDNRNELASIFVILAKGVQAADEITEKIFTILRSHITAEELNVIRDIYYVESIPVTTCGKVDRAALKKLASTYTEIN